MGWAGAGGILDTVANSLIGAKVSDEVIRTVCADLIRELVSEDWDTTGETLGEWSDTPAVVQAFRDNKIYLDYCDEPHPEQGFRYCREEKNHEGDHKAWRCEPWPQAAEATS